MGIVTEQETISPSFLVPKTTSAKNQYNVIWKRDVSIVKS